MADLSEVNTAIDLFAGAGGATAGLRLAGFAVVAAVEADDVAARTYALNHPDVDLRVADIKTIDPLSLRGLGQRPRLGLLTACPPCQGFSTLGKGDSDDIRNDLVDQVWRFTRALRPRAVLMENVPGLVRDGRLHSLERKLRGAGYGVRHYLVDASWFGVPQRRKRLIMIAVEGVRSSRFPRELGPSDGPPQATMPVFAYTANLDPSLDPLHRHRSHSPKVAARIAAIPVGGSRFDLPEEHQLGCHRRVTTRSAAASYGRVSLVKPSATMTTRCTTPACGAFVHPTENRGISLREAALLQSFPPDYRFEGTHEQIERQIGNAVPVQLAAGLATVVCRLAPSLVALVPSHSLIEQLSMHATALESDSRTRVAEAG